VWKALHRKPVSSRNSYKFLISEIMRGQRTTSCGFLAKKGIRGGSECRFFLTGKKPEKFEKNSQYPVRRSQCQKAIE